MELGLLTGHSKCAAGVCTPSLLRGLLLKTALQWAVRDGKGAGTVGKPDAHSQCPEFPTYYVQSRLRCPRRASHLSGAASAR